MHSEPDARRAGRRRSVLPAATADLVQHFVFGVPENVGKAPPCDPQAPLGNIVGQAQQFPHLQPLP